MAEAAGVSLPEHRLAVMSDALAELLELAASLEELPLDGVEPALGRPDW